MTRRVLRILTRGLIGLIAVVVVAVGALAWRLSAGPISVGFLTSHIEAALEDPETGDSVKIGDTVVLWDRDRADLALAVTDFRAIRPSGEMRARIERTKVSLSLRALLQGIVAVKAIAVEGAQLRLVRAADGSLGFSGRKPPAQPEQAPEAGATTAEPEQTGDMSDATGPLFKALLAEPNPDVPISYLRRASFENSRLTIEDALLGITLELPVRQIQAYHHDQGINFDLDADLDIEGEVTTLHMDALFEEATEKIDLTASFSNLTPSAVSDVLRLDQLAPLGGIKLSLTGSVQLRGGLDGRIDELQADVAAGRPGTVSVVGVLPDPVPVSHFEANGRFDGETGSVKIKEFDVTLGPAGGPGPAIALAVDIDSVRNDVPVLRANAELRDLEMSVLDAYWPADAVAGARAWVTQNIRAGSVERATVDAELTVPEMRFGDAALTRFAADFGFALPSEQQTLELTSRVAFAADTGRVDVETDFSQLNPSAVPAITAAASELKGLRIPLSGKAVASIGRDGGLRRLELDITGGAGTLSFSKIFTDVLDVASLRARGAYDAEPGEAMIEEISVALGKTAGTGPTINITANAEDLWGKGTITAQAAVDRIGMNQIDRYWPKGAAENARAWVTENIPKGTVNRATVRLAMRAAEGQIDKAEVSSVTGEIRYKDLEVHYLRPLDPIQGVTGTAKFDLKSMRFKVEPGATVKEFKMTGADIAIAGLDIGKETMDLKFGLDGPAKSLVSILHSPRLDLISGLGLDPTEVGGNLDLTGELVFPLLAELDLEDMDIKSAAKSKRLVLNTKAPGYALVDLNTQIHYTRVGWNTIKASGRTTAGEQSQAGAASSAPEGQGAAKTGKFDISFAPGSSGRYVLSATAEDAGAMLRAMRIADGLEGGELKITGQTDGTAPDTPLRAELDMKGYKMREASRTARTLAATGSPTAASRAMSGPGLTIDEHKAEIVFHNRVITIESMHFKASSLGGTARGTVDLDKSELDVSGMLVPLDNVSGVLRSIPVIQGLFSERGGLIAFNFRLTGPLEDPSTQVQAAKSLTPHVVQRLFGGGEGRDDGDGGQGRDDRGGGEAAPGDGS